MKKLVSPGCHSPENRFISNLPCPLFKKEGEYLPFLKGGKEGLLIFMLLCKGHDNAGGFVLGLMATVLCLQLSPQANPRPWTCFMDCFRIQNKTIKWLKENKFVFELFLLSSNTSFQFPLPALHSVPGTPFSCSFSLLFQANNKIKPSFCFKNENNYLITISIKKKHQHHGYNFRSQ